MTRLEDVYAVYEYNNAYFIDQAEPLYVTLVSGEPQIFALRASGMLPVDADKNFRQFLYSPKGLPNQAKLQSLKREKMNEVT